MINPPKPDRCNDSNCFTCKNKITTVSFSDLFSHCEKLVLSYEPNDEGKRDYDVIINAIVGKGFLSHQDAMEFEQKKYTKFCGNQHNEDWCWDIDKLKTLSLHTLLEIYHRDSKKGILNDLTTG